MYYFSAALSFEGTLITVSGAISPLYQHTFVRILFVSPFSACVCDSPFCWCWLADPRTQMVSVDRPCTKDVEKWGLTGERAAQFGMVVRWVRTRLATHERASEATSRCVCVFPQG